MTTPTARGAMTIDMAGRVLYQKDPDTPYNLMSITKCMTAYLVYKHEIPHDQQAEVQADDTAPGTTMGLQVGDIVSVRDLLYGLMLPSGNDVGRVLGRLVGQKLLDAEQSTGSAIERHIAEMNDQGELWGWGQGFTFTGPSGYPNTQNRVSARQVVDLWRRAVLDYPDLSDVAGALTHQAEIIGPNARSLTLNHTIDPEGTVPFPEFVSGKTGGISGSNPARSAVFYWIDPETDEGRISVILATPERDPVRYNEMRAQMDHVMRSDAPTGGSFMVGGKSPLTMTAGGKAVTAVKLGSRVVWQ